MKIFSVDDSSYHKEHEADDKKKQLATSLDSPQALSSIYGHSLITKTKRSQLTKLLTEWSLQSHFHCYPKIFQYKNVYAKQIWALTFLFFTALTLFLIGRDLVNYFEYEVVSKIEVFDQKPIEFPTVTICDGNPFTSETAERLIDKIVNETFGQELNAASEFADAGSAKHLLDAIEMAKMYVAGPQYTQADRRELGLIARDNVRLLMSRHCLFSKKECDFATDFNWYYNYQQGNCWQFNAGKSSPRKIKETILEGPNYGLNLWIGPLDNHNG